MNAARKLEASTMRFKDRGEDIKFNAPMKERVQILHIVQRARLLLGTLRFPDELELYMDIAAVHLNGCPLDLKRLSEAEDRYLVHDVVGINEHLDRDTGKLFGHFLPRYRKKG